jgi:hypothetical protein
MAFYQGELDGLCGMYAIVNAVELCDESIDSEEVFKLACLGLAHSKWPAVLWEGTSLRQLQFMLKNITERYPTINVKYPFLVTQPSSNELFWNAFDEIFDAPASTAVCAIVRIASEQHWTIISPEGRRLAMVDSTANEQHRTKNRKSLFAGKKRENNRQMLVVKEDVIVFYIAE